MPTPQWEEIAHLNIHTIHHRNRSPSDLFLLLFEFLTFNHLNLITLLTLRCTIHTFGLNQFLHSLPDLFDVSQYELQIVKNLKDMNILNYTLLDISGIFLLLLVLDECIQLSNELSEAGISKFLAEECVHFLLVEVLNGKVGSPEEEIEKVADEYAFLFLLGEHGENIEECHRPSLKEREELLDRDHELLEDG